MQDLAPTTCSDLRTEGSDVFTRFKAGRDGTLWYYAALAELFRRRLDNPIAPRLGETVETLLAEAALPG